MFKFEEFMGKKVLKSSLIKDGAVAFFTTREISLKSGERDDLIEFVENSKNLVCEGFGIQSSQLVIPQQTHSDNVERVDKSLSTIQPFNYSTYDNTDALVTNEKDIALALNFADCVPIIFYDEKKHVSGIAHAGWKGTVAQIGPKTVSKMVEDFGSNPEDIIALIGPAIGKCCFEVKDDVMEKLKQVTPKEAFEEVFSNSFADLKLINKHQLLASGLKKIDVCEYCTSCSNELFFSYRKEQGNTARHSAVIKVQREM